MKKTLAAATIAISALYACSASANNGIYVSGDLGLSIINMHDTRIDYSESSNGRVSDTDTTKFKNTHKGVFGGGVAVGYDFNDQYQLPVRIDFSAKFRSNAESNQTFTDDFANSESIKNKVRMDTYMVNGYYDFYNSSDFTPYLTAGIGMSHLKHNISDEEGETMSANSNNFAWGVGAGVKYAITSNISIDASYRYIDGGKVTNSKTENWSDDGASGTNTFKTKTKASSNDLMLGVSYKF